MGEARRSATWRELFEAVGASVDEVRLLELGSRRSVHLRPAELRRLASGALVPEVAAWPAKAAARVIARLDPTVVVFVTSRAFRADLIGGHRTAVLDFVDELSASYRDRAAIGRRRVGRAAYQALALAHHRFERRDRPEVRRVAAGFEDARRLGADWLPVMAPSLRRVDSLPRKTDLAFIGNLAYPPNIAAVRTLDAMWDSLIDRRPSTTLLLAGRHPVDEVRESVARRGWTLLADFGALEHLSGVAAVALAPLSHTAGIQMKVLDAAALGLPQVVTPAALLGMLPGFPAVVAELSDFSDAVVGLLEDQDTAAALSAAAAAHVEAHYRPHAWTTWASEILSQGA